MSRIEKVNKPFSSFSPAGAMAFVQALREDRLVPKTRPGEVKKKAREDLKRFKALRDKIRELPPDVQHAIAEMLRNG